MEEHVSKDHFYKIALKNYAQRLAQYNQWVDAQIKLQGDRFVTRLMTYAKLPSALTFNAEASGCSSTPLTDLNLQDTLLLHTRNFFDWALACVRVAYEQTPISTNRDSAVLVSAEALLERISIGHPLVYGAIVDQLFLQFTRIGFDRGIVVLGNHINRSTCASARKDDITRKLASMGRLRPGSSMFDINVPMKDGPSLPLSRLTKDKPLSLLLFWSAGCSHCMELIEGMMPKMSSPDINARLQVIAVSLDRSDADRQKWEQTIARLPDWRHSILADGPKHPLAQAFGVLATPTMFLIEGKEFRLKALPSGLGELQQLLKP
jgi:peroxiredoxin